MTSNDPAAADLERSSERWIAWFAGETAGRRHPPASALHALWDALEEWFASDDFAGSALADTGGEVVAHALATWVEIDRLPG